MRLFSLIGHIRYIDKRHQRRLGGIYKGIPVVYPRLVGAHQFVLYMARGKAQTGELALGV